MGVLLASLLGLGVAAAGGPLAAEAAPAYADKFEAAKALVDEGPTPGEIDAVLRSARRSFATDQAGLLLPVDGIAATQLVDTFGAARSGGRSHGAIDIMAPRGSLVLSAADGVVERLHRSSLGGITAYVRSTDGDWVYYYAHLDSYAPGLEAGQRLRRGDPIGRVGSTGNAQAAWPHLHFAMYRMAPGARWYQGRPVNPYPLLAGNARRR
ncbi:MAG TPA: M23 family metallopeptidase [Allosphingosinicella sp.]|nr:M23 family metallopeptidase [Allosphingosinicella sp.]